MNRDEHVKLLTQTAATLLQSSDMPLPFCPRAIETAMDTACEIVDAAIKAAVLVEETGGLYQD
jgi:hypothetical protein